MTVYAGAGAGQAIEDALILSYVLSLISHPRQIPHAFKCYDEVRRPRSQRAAISSREAGELIGLEEGMVERLGGVEGVGRELGGRMEWLWGANVEGMVGEVEERFWEGVADGKGGGKGRM